MSLRRAGNQSRTQTNSKTLGFVITTGRWPFLKIQKSIFFSFAHPDDESFSVAGIASKYGAQGVRLALSCATRGQAGKAGDPPICSPEQLPVVREAELREAATLLGIEHLHLLEYRDKHLAAAAPEEIRRQLLSFIRLYRPQIVITFDPNGANLHSDHIAISRFTSDAVAAAADPRWFPEAGPPHLVQRLLWTTPVPLYKLALVPNLADQPGVDFVIDIKPWWERKAQALRAHRTQHLSIDRIWFHQPDPEKLLSQEMFCQAWGPALPARPSDDLFADLD
jgi:N-acetylglucosamine malate deacetylase 2